MTRPLRSTARNVKRSLEVLTVGMSPAVARDFQRWVRRKRNRLLRAQEGRGGDRSGEPYPIFKRAAKEHWVDHWVKQHPPSPGGTQEKPPFRDYGSVLMPQVGELWKKEKIAQDTEQPVFNPATVTWDDMARSAPMAAG